MIAPPGQAPGQVPGQAPGSAADARALFAEARRRRRRRRIAGTAVTLAVAGLIAAGRAGRGRPQAPGHVARSAPRPAVIITPRAARFTLPAAHVAWVDYSGELHIGDVATGTQQVVANVPSDSGGWFVRAGGHLYWPGFSTNKDIGAIRDYAFATGKIRYLGRGESVFASADGRHVYIMRSGARLTELPAGGSGVPRRLTVPAGWHLSFPQPVTVAGGGIVVIANGDPRKIPQLAFAVWYPRTGKLRVVGRGGGVMAAYTPRHAHHSLLAWSAGPCRNGNCLLKITNTSTLATVAVRSPLGHGFTDPGAAFSPDGRQLAALARTASLSSASCCKPSELAIVNTRTGTLRLVAAARLGTTEDAGWARWLPGGKRLLAGALSESYVVDAKTLAARPFFFFPGRADHDIMDTPDINFSAVVITSGQAHQAVQPKR
jgi:hypothetical protein